MNFGDDQNAWETPSQPTINWEIDLTSNNIAESKVEEMDPSRVHKNNNLNTVFVEKPSKLTNDNNDTIWGNNQENFANSRYSDEKVFRSNESDYNHDQHIHASYSDDEYHFRRKDTLSELDDRNYHSFQNINEDLLNRENILTDNIDISGNDGTELLLSTKTESFEKWSIKIKNSYNSISPDIIEVKELKEKEGFIFKHINYSIKVLGELNNSEFSSTNSVVRRYSDFEWLRDVLLKKYPFRLIPLLPPKHIGIQTPNRSFLDARKEGLSKFINMVIRHPVLKEEELTITFLTVPTDISSWRKTAIYDTSDEHCDKKISEEFKKMYDTSLLDGWRDIYNALNKSINLWAKLLNLVEGHQYKEFLIAKQNLIFKNVVHEFANQTTALYPNAHSSTTYNINTHLQEIGKHLHKSSELQKNESLEFINSLVPKFVNYILILKSMKELRQRYDILSINNIEKLRRRIFLNEEKLEGMKGKPDFSGVDYDRIMNIVKQDKKRIRDQTNKSWLIKQTILEEFTIFQQTQFIITQTFQQWTMLHAKYHGLELNEWEALAVDLTRMATIE